MGLQTTEGPIDPLLQLVPALVNIGLASAEAFSKHRVRSELLEVLVGGAFPTSTVNTEREYLLPIDRVTMDKRFHWRRGGGAPNWRPDEDRIVLLDVVDVGRDWAERAHDLLLRGGGDGNKVPRRVGHLGRDFNDVSTSALVDRFGDLAGRVRPRVIDDEDFALCHAFHRMNLNAL